MRYLNQNSDLSELDDSVEPIIRSMLNNRRILNQDEIESAARVTSSIKFTSQTQSRRNFREYDGGDKHVSRILDILGFDTYLDFQVDSWKKIHSLDQEKNKTGESQALLFTAPTGFGKTECYLGPTLNYIANDHYDNVVLVYPRKALLKDQFQRVLSHIHELNNNWDSISRDISVGVYYGSTPYSKDAISSKDDLVQEYNGTKYFQLSNCPKCEEEIDYSESEYDSTPLFFNEGNMYYSLNCPNNHSFSDSEVKLNRQDIVNDPPNILLTTLESLETFSLKPHYDIVDKADAIVFDELHLYNGIYGSHAANIINNIDQVTDNSLLFLGSSATLDDASSFGSKMFGREPEVISPTEEDFDETEDRENYFFIQSSEDVGLTSTFIQQNLMCGHSLLNPEDEDKERYKILSFIDSTSQINQKTIQMEDAEQNQQLWRFHLTNDEEGWDTLAEDTGHDIIDNPLDIKHTYSGRSLSSSQMEGADVINSTSTLEVGIDVPSIKIISQYRTPWNYSSFVQRTGRAAREQGMDSHVMMFLSNTEEDENVFYRADRFLESEITVPLNVDNEIIEWIHETFLKYYQISDEVRQSDLPSEDEEEKEFLNRFLVEFLGLEKFRNFLRSPEVVLNEILEEEKDSMGSIRDIGVSAIRKELVNPKKSIKEELEPILDYADVSEKILYQRNYLERLNREVRESVLRDLNKYEDNLSSDKMERYCGLPSETDIFEDKEAKRQELLETIEELKEKVKDGEDDLKEMRDVYLEVGSRVSEITGTLVNYKRVRISTSDDVKFSLPFTLGNLRSRSDSLLRAAQKIEQLTDNEDIEDERNQLKRIYYLENALNELEGRDGYLGIERRHLSLAAVKSLLRSAYFFQRYLEQTDGVDEKIWYVPENYFGGGGSSFRVISDKDYTEDSDVPLSKLIYKYAPFKAEYMNSGQLIRISEPNVEVDGDQRVMEFSNVTGDFRDGVLVPREINMTEVRDISQEQGRAILKFCPECFQLIEGDECPEHRNHEYGRIHSDPHVDTEVKSRDVNRGENSNIQLSDVQAKVFLSSVDLEITPAQFFDNSWNPISSRSRSVRLQSPPKPLGFIINSRGVTWNLDNLEERIAGMEEKLDELKNLDEIDAEELTLHTAAHFLLLLVSDVAGVNPNILYYSVDRENNEVSVFERTEGGQGIVDLFYEKIDTNPGRVIESAIRTGFNSQIINERLWTKEEFIDDIQDNNPRNVVEDHLNIEYEQVVEKVTEEVKSTINDIEEASEISDQSISEAYETKKNITQQLFEGRETDEITLDLEEREHIINLLASPDIDGCVANLHISNCVHEDEQIESLSYIALEDLLQDLLEVSEDGAEAMFGEGEIPAGVVNDKTIFLRF